MSAIHQKDLQSQAFLAVDEYAAWHKFGIVRDGGRIIGTGVAIRFGNRHMFVTAAHVVEDCALDSLCFLFRPPGPLLRGHPSELPSRYQEIALTPRTTITMEDIALVEELDLAFMEVSPTLSEQYRIKFFELTPEAVAPPVGTPVLSSGYPTDLALPMGGQDRLLVPFGTVAPIIGHPDPESLKRFDSQRNFLVPYALAKNGHARGFSGAPAWFQKPTLELWYPNLGLAGVCTHYYEKSALLSFIRAEEVVRHLQQLGRESRDIRSDCI